MVATALVLAPAAAQADTRVPRPAASCTGPVPTAIKAKLHEAATRRVTTLGELVTRLSASPDPFGLNAGQVSTLQDASAGIEALDGTIQSTCYGTVAELRASGQRAVRGLPRLLAARSPDPTDRGRGSARRHEHAAVGLGREARGLGSVTTPTHRRISRR